MSNDPQELANEVVESFKDLLDDEALDAVGEYHLHALQGMLRRAIAQQTEFILERLEKDLHQLKAEMIERSPLEL